MTYPTTRSRRSPVPVRLLVLAVLVLGGAPAPSSTGEPDAGEDLCPYLPPERQVSYKHQESKLFREVVERTERSEVSAPHPLAVARAFAACLSRLRDRETTEAESSEGGRAAAREPEHEDRIRFEISEDGTRVEAALGEAPARTYRLRGSVPELAKRVTRDLVARADGESREALANRVWFLWFESYLRATGQRHSSYDYASDVIAQEAASRGRSFGVGVEVEMADGRMLVSGIRDERLDEAGLAVADEIVALDGTPVETMDLPQLQRYWLNPRPFGFTLEARRGDETVSLRGESVPTRHRTTAWSVRGDTGYIRVHSFSGGSLIELRRALRDLDARQVRRIVLDVRGNPGGTLASGLVDVFFKPGQTVVSYRERGAADAVDVDASVEYCGLPAAVLADRESASMAEVLVAAFRAHERGPVLGETTYGKGVGQKLYPVLDEGKLHLVERTYFYPGTRESWDLQGIEPDVVIELDDEDRDRLEPYLDSHVVRLEEQWGVDPVLRAAEKQLKETP